jgi:hypothetical protein
MSVTLISPVLKAPQLNTVRKLRTGCQLVVLGPDPAFTHGVSCHNFYFGLDPTYASRKAYLHLRTGAKEIGR